MTASRPRPGWTLALTSVAFFMMALDTTVVVTALPAIHREIGGSLPTLEWVVNGYLLAFAASMLAGIVGGLAVGSRSSSWPCRSPAWLPGPTSPPVFQPPSRPASPPG